MIQELRDKMGRLAEENRQLLKKAFDEKREMTPEETQQFEARDADYEAAKRTADAYDKTETYGESRGRRTQPNTAGSNRAEGRASTGEAIRSWLRADAGIELTEEEVARAKAVGVDPRARQIGIDLMSQTPLTDCLPPGFGCSQGRSVIGPDVLSLWEMRTAMETGNATAGGSTIQREQFRQFEVALISASGMRQAASVFRTETGTQIPWPTINDTGNVGERVGESDPAGANTAPATGVVNFDSYKYGSKPVIVSREFLEDTGIPFESMIFPLLGERIGRITNLDYTTGNGTNLPLGLYVAANVGYTGAASNTAVFTRNDLLELEHSVNPIYRTNAKYMFHDKTLLALKKLVDDDGRALWQASLALGTPDRLNGYPYVINMDAPEPAPGANTTAAGAASIAFGQLDKYKIRDVRQVHLVRDASIYVLNDQVAFIAWFRTDGDLVDAGTRPVRLFKHGPKTA